MLPKGFGWQHFLPYFLLTDRAAFGPIPKRALRFLALSLLPLGVLLGLSSLQTGGIVFGLGLLALLGLLLDGLLTFRAQKEFEDKLYREFDHAFGASSPSYDADEARKVIKRNLKTKWRGKTLESVVMRGEGGKASDRDVRRFLEWLSAADSDSSYTYLIDEPEAVSMGTIQARRVARDSQEARSFADQMKVLTIFSNTTWARKSSGFPTIVLEHFDPAKTPVAFSGVMVKDFSHDAISDYEVEKLLGLFEKAYPLPTGQKWNFQALSSDSIRIYSGEISALESNSETDVKLLNSIFTAAKKRYDLEVEKRDIRDKRLGFIAGEFEVLAYEADVLSAFRIEFRSCDSLHDPMILKNFTACFLHFLNREVPGKWRIKNDLVRNSSLTFRRDL